jgi:hypothetical protein
MKNYRSREVVELANPKDGSGKVLLGIGAVAGLGALIYYVTRPSTAAASPAPTPTGTTGIGALGSMNVPSRTSSLRGGQQLLAGQSLYSPLKLYRLTMQTDNNLVVYTNANINLLYNRAGIPIWATTTANSCAVRAIMQTDGNFVLYKTKISSAPIYAAYSSNTQGNPGSWITMQDDGNLVIYAPNGRALWASKNQPPPYFFYGPNDCAQYQGL